MAHDQRIDELRTELEAARWDMYCGAQDLNHQFNLGGRVRRSIRSEPWKWIAAIALTGVVAGRLAPFLIRRSAKGWASKLGTQFARQTVTAAAPLLAAMAGEALQRRYQRRHPPP